MPASLGNFAADMITRLGGKPTPGAQKLFGAWQRWEGGHTANDALWNPLNLTAPGSGLRKINSVGVVAMPNYQEGVRRTAELIAKGYPSLAKAFRTGAVNFQDPGVQGDLNRWLSGKRTPAMTPYVSKIARAYGAPGVITALNAVGSIPGVSTPAVEATAPKLDRQLMSRNIRDQIIAGRGRMDLLGLPRLLRQSYDQGTPGTPASFTPGQADTLPSTPAQAAPLRADPNGKWGGSKSVASQLAQIGLSNGLSATSEKRDRQSTKSGGVSDHWSGSLNSYAYDLSNGSSPTKEMDATARQILRRLGVNWDGHSPVVVSKNVGGYRVQVLYRTQVGGNHNNHVHLGVRKL